MLKGNKTASLFSRCGPWEPVAGGICYQFQSYHYFQLTVLLALDCYNKVKKPKYLDRNWTILLLYESKTPTNVD